MKLLPMNNPRPGQSVQCVKCAGMIPAAQALADMEGVPFKSFYHPDCVPACQVWTCLETVKHPSGTEYYTWKAISGGKKGIEPIPYYNITDTPLPPTTEAGYFSYGYLLKVKGIMPGDTLQSIFQKSLK